MPLEDSKRRRRKGDALAISAGLGVEKDGDHWMTKSMKQTPWVAAEREEARRCRCQSCWKTRMSMTCKGFGGDDCAAEAQVAPGENGVGGVGDDGDEVVVVDDDDGVCDGMARKKEQHHDTRRCYWW